MGYRSEWIKHNGPIPKDERGRAYEIHHINGDHSDNRMENLRCVTIEEHFDIHFEQGDMRAAAAIARRMMVGVDKQSELNRLAGLEAKRKNAGIHGLSKEENRANGLKGGLAVRGMRWWTDGLKDIKAREHPGNGWQAGRCCSTTGPKVGTKIGVFWNNGSENKRAFECPGEGWVRGKFLTPEQRERRREISRKPKQKRKV